ncbi:MAG: S8 family peptidase [Acidobacteriota bacterium]
MQRRSVAILTLTAFLLALAPQAKVSSTLSARFARGEVIVKLKDIARSSPDTEMTAARALGERQSAAVEPLTEPLAAPAHPINEIITRRGLDRVFLLRFDPDDDIDSIISQLRSDPAVEYAEPNYLIEPASVIPADPEFYRQWALRNLGTGAEGQPSTFESDIKATDAWEITTGNPSVLVAVTDTGVDINHPDLVGNIYTNPREIAANGVDDDQNGYTDDVHGFNVADRNSDVSDIVGHGTQMSGIIAARSNNGVGISGVSQSKILPVKFFRRTGPNPSDFEATIADAARALLYSIAAGARIINASWRTLLRDTSESESQALRDAVLATLDAGALLVCIAGNDAFDNDIIRVYPGAYQLENQIVVAASDYNDDLWHALNDPTTLKSGYGKRTVHLAAPGALVLTLLARGDCVTCSASADPEDWYGAIDGTSAAAAYVSGVAALVKSHFPDANYSVIRRRILEGVERRESLDRFVQTGGRLSAFGALTVELQIIPPVITRIKVKGSGKKLFIYGEKMQRDAVAVVDGVAYPTSVASDDLSRLKAKVPKSAFPAGVEVAVYLRNPDGGESQRVTYVR